MGEFELIAKLRERLHARAAPRDPAGRVVTGSGDDAAVTVPPGATATSVDLAVEGVHFERETAPFEAIGHKAMAAALSDLAAMGAEPGEAYVQLGVPGDVDEDDLLDLADGVAMVAGAHGVVVAGGDLSDAPALVIAVTVVGHAASAGDLVPRGGAREGDMVCVTGELGAAAAGLLLLRSPELRDAVSADVAESLIGRQLRPRAQVDPGTALARTGARAMIDVSDGVAADARHIAAASGLRIEIDATRLPVAAGVAEVAAAAGVDSLVLAAGGGEDYELLAALPEGSVDAASQSLEALGVRLTPIGRATAGEGTVIRGPDGETVRIRGFEHGPTGAPRTGRARSG